MKIKFITTRRDIARPGKGLSPSEITFLKILSPINYMGWKIILKSRTGQDDWVDTEFKPTQI